MVNEEIMDKMKEKPSWLEEHEEYWLVDCGKTQYKIKELKASDVDRYQLLADKTKIPFERLLIAKGMIEPEITDIEIDDLRGSHYMKLKMAIVHIYGLNNFL